MGRPRIYGFRLPPILNIAYFALFVNAFRPVFLLFYSHRNHFDAAAFVKKTGSLDSYTNLEISLNLFLKSETWRFLGIAGIHSSNNNLS